MGRISPPLGQPLGRTLSSPTRDISNYSEHRTIQKMERSINTDRRIGLAKNQSRRQDTDHAFIEVNNYCDDWNERIISKNTLLTETDQYNTNTNNNVTPSDDSTPGPDHLDPVEPNPYPWQPYPGAQWVGPGGWASLAALQAAYPYYEWIVSPRNFSTAGTWYYAYV